MLDTGNGRGSSGRQQRTATDRTAGCASRAPLVWIGIRWSDQLPAKSGGYRAGHWRLFCGRERYFLLYFWRLGFRGLGFGLLGVVACPVPFLKYRLEWATPGNEPKV
jgi:hypothetical protein